MNFKEIIQIINGNNDIKKNLKTFGKSLVTLLLTIGIVLVENDVRYIFLKPVLDGLLNAVLHR